MYLACVFGATIQCAPERDHALAVPCGLSGAERHLSPQHQPHESWVAAVDEGSARKSSPAFVVLY